MQLGTGKKATMNSNCPMHQVARMHSSFGKNLNYKEVEND